jgi:hypothetical protein
MLAKSARSIGFDEYTVIQLKWYVDELKRGTFAVGAPTDIVAQLTGRPPENMETIARRYLHTMPGTQRGPSGMARAMSVLAKSVVTRAPSRKRYLRTFQDGAAIGTLSVDSEQWRTTHDPERMPKVEQPRLSVTGTVVR